MYAVVDSETPESLVAKLHAVFGAPIRKYRPQYIHQLTHYRHSYPNADR
jgi:hypothetical protein